MTRIARLIAGCAIACGTLAITTVCASAALKVCNRTSYIVYAASGTQTKAALETEGWTRITPGACATVIDGALKSASYYVYAQSSRAHTGLSRAWGGNVFLCVAHGHFQLRRPGSSAGCPPDQGFAVGFAAVKTHRKADWTETLTETDEIATLEQARLAGLQRLLIDNGYQIKKPDGEVGAIFRTTLDRFRSSRRLAANTSDADLFSALEKAASATAAPAGYSVCNTTGKPLWASIGMNDEKSWFARGWWKIPPAECASLISTPLSDERYFLRVEQAGGKSVIAGTTPFCITDIAFEIEGRTNCKGRGMKQAGFLETLTGGKDGLAVHIGPHGLMPAEKNAQVGIPK